MKRVNSFFLLLLCCAVFQGQAQVSIGLRTGYTKAWQNYGDTPLPDNARVHVNGFHVTGMAYLNLSKHLRIGVEPGFVQRGAACEPGFIIFEADTKLHLNYLDIPLMFSGSLPFLADRFSLYGKLGYGPSMLLSAFELKEDLFGDGPLPSKTKRPIGNAVDSVRRWDHGLYSSIGLSYTFGQHQLILETKGHAGLRNVEMENTSLNRSLKLSLGYMILL